jgi:hypothetical protein
MWLEQVDGFPKIHCLDSQTWESLGAMARFGSRRLSCLSRIGYVAQKRYISGLLQTESERFCVKENQVTTPDELLQTLRRYLNESSETERAIASQIGVNHHTLSRWLSDKQSPKKGRLALTACFLRRVGYL